MSHCFLKTLGLEKHITLIFFCFSQRLRFSFSSEKKTFPQSNGYLQNHGKFLLSFSSQHENWKTFGELIKGTERVLCFLAKEAASLSRAI